MNEFQSLQSMHEIETFINENTVSFLYITTPNCSVCHGLRPQIEKMFTKYPKIATRQVDAEEVPEIAGRFSVFTAPVLILFVDGKEYLREARIVQTQLLDQQIAKIYNGVFSS